MGRSFHEEKEVPSWIVTVFNVIYFRRKVALIGVPLLFFGIVNRITIDSLIFGRTVSAMGRTTIVQVGLSMIDLFVDPIVRRRKLQELVVRSSAIFLVNAVIVEETQLLTLLMDKMVIRLVDRSWFALTVRVQMEEASCRIVEVVTFSTISL